MTAGPAAGDEYLASFSEPVGYLNFGSYGPPSRPVVETITRLATQAGEGVPSSGLHAEDERALAAVARLTGFDRSAVALTSSTSLGLLQIAFGVPQGRVLVSTAEFPSNLYAWWRAEEAGRLTVQPLPAQGSGFGGSGLAGPGLASEAHPLDPVTPDRVAAALELFPDTVAVAVSAVDFRTGYRADLVGLRAVVGDRLLIVDGIQGFGVIEADWTAADALVVGGQKWLRAGWGTGFVALSSRALARLRPVVSGWTGVEGVTRYDGVPHELLPGAQRLSITNGSPFASGALATALEQVESVGISTIEGLIENTVSTFVNRLEVGGHRVLSPRSAHERAGIVVLGRPAGDAAAVHARLDSAGITATLHGDDRIRFSVHATTTPAAIDAVMTVLGETA
ncbi:aminotransferase class V-fold PLP-dependent enzyme [Frigoribacterium sp. 2-23]|uniref:aminotransferase class V-fold PLP-dependent enzyme n=1 Tax=Frigoribacterium sp. 2-23 TaxID=3415006 RepID=UPI003C6ED704